MLMFSDLSEMDGIKQRIETAVDNVKRSTAEIKEHYCPNTDR